MKDNLLKHLNPIQQQAVATCEGPVIIFAGAGSGKTRVLTYKVAYLIGEKKIPAENILMMTFTNKAAGEMKERIQRLLTDNRSLITDNCNLPFAGTFHSFCAKILRREGKVIGIPADFLIYDTSDQQQAIKEVCQRADVDKKRFHPNAILSTISQIKNELISPSEYADIARGLFQEIVAKIYPAYQKFLFHNKALDFDDLLMKTVELFRNYPQIAKKYQESFHYVLIDEYQDTNHAQYILTRILTSKWKNICVVGDASQSIYTWRGADFRNIINFTKDFPKAKIFNLEQNYRSSQNILEASFAVISRNTSHPILKLWTDKDQGQPIYIYQARNELEEAQFVVNIIQELKLKTKAKYADFAVLYRTNAQSRVIEEAFLHASIPYLLVGGVRFYERKEIKDVLSYLKLVISPHDLISQKRIEKIGKKRSLEFHKYLSKQKDGYIKKHTTRQILDEIMQITKYLDLYDIRSEEDLYRLENIKELQSVAEQYPDLTSFLENVSLVEQEYFSGHPYKDRSIKNAATLMTLHAAKGLEFQTIFIIGMEEGLFPHMRALLDQNEIEEERRLCYVGMTRAKEQLYLTYTSNRLYFGQRTSNYASRFLSDLPKGLTLSLTTDNFT